MIFSFSLFHPIIWLVPFSSVTNFCIQINFDSGHFLPPNLFFFSSSLELLSSGEKNAIHFINRPICILDLLDAEYSSYYCATADRMRERKMSNTKYSFSIPFFSLRFELRKSNGKKCSWAWSIRKLERSGSIEYMTGGTQRARLQVLLQHYNDKHDI